MILKAKERGNAPQLARYLMQMRDNDHVELHEVRGFASSDLPGAFREAEAIAAGTRCQNHLFSMSLNPPQGGEVSVAAFEEAIDRIEQKLGLEGQPRAVIFHEKDGRRHAHAVWSRIDSERMRAINLPHYKVKLRDLSREFFREHGWQMPRGLRDPQERDPLLLTREQWQQATRNQLNPKQLKGLFKEAWEISDNRDSFENALRDRGLWLARGDRRGFVAIDYRAEVYNVAKWVGVKTKEVEARLGDRDHLPSIDSVKAEIARGMTQTLQRYIREIERDAKRRSASLDMRRTQMVERHRAERKALKERQEQRWIAETKARAERLTKGLKGVWHWLTGRNRDVRKLNEKEAFDAYRRDRAETDGLIVRQLEEREGLQREIREHREQKQTNLLQLRADVARYQDFREDNAPDNERKQSQHEERDERQRNRHRRRRERMQDTSRDGGPSPC